MLNNKFLNTKETATALGVSTSYLRKLERLGLPYHQLSNDSYKYFQINEIDEWLQKEGFVQRKTWRKQS